MKRLFVEGVITYDDEMMHGDDLEAEAWFRGYCTAYSGIRSVIVATPSHKSTCHPETGKILTLGHFLRPEVRLQHIGGYIEWTSESLPACYAGAVRILSARGYEKVD